MYTDGTRHESFYLEQSLGRPSDSFHGISTQVLNGSSWPAQSWWQLFAACQRGGTWQARANEKVQLQGFYWTKAKISELWHGALSGQNSQFKISTYTTLQIKFMFILLTFPSTGLCSCTDIWERLSSPLDTLIGRQQSLTCSFLKTIFWFNYTENIYLENTEQYVF